MKNIKSDYLFIISLLLIFLIYGYQNSTKLGTYSPHQWRQSDCVSITSNYYEEDLNFLEPKINWCGNGANRKVISEFPIIYYSVAKLWKLFGKHLGIFRLVNLIIFSIGLYALFKIFKNILKDNFWSITLTLFLFTSPLLSFYANNFIMNSTAFSFVMIAFYFTNIYYREFKIKLLIYLSFFFLLAALLKITALLSFIGLLPIHLYIILKRNNIKNMYFHLIPPIIVFILIFSWYSYAKYYNESNLQGIFLQGILPYWELDSLQIKNLIKLLYHKLLPSYFSQSISFFILIIFIYSLLNFKKANKFLLILSINCLVGSILYISLFFQVFNVHDYYLINLLIIVPLVILTFFDLLRRFNSEIFKIKSLKIIGFIILSCLIYNTAIINRIKYNSYDNMAKNSFLIDNKTINNQHKFHLKYENSLKPLKNIEPHLRKLGIRREDKVISIPDNSINISLTLMNQIGFTDFGFNSFKEDKRIKHFINLGAKYLIVNDSTLCENDYLKPFLSNQIGKYKNVKIYDLM